MCTRPQPKSTFAHQLAAADHDGDENSLKFSTFCPYPPVSHNEFVSEPPLPQSSVPFELFPSPFAEPTMSQLPSLMSFNEPLFTDYATLLPPRNPSDTSIANKTDAFFSPLTSAFVHYVQSTPQSALQHTLTKLQSINDGAMSHPDISAPVDAHTLTTPHTHSLATPVSAPQHYAMQWQWDPIVLDGDDGNCTPIANSDAQDTRGMKTTDVLRTVWKGYSPTGNSHKNSQPDSPDHLSPEDIVRHACATHTAALETHTRCQSQYTTITDTLRGYRTELDTLIAPLQAASEEKRQAGVEAVMAAAVMLGTLRTTLPCGNTSRDINNVDSTSVADTVNEADERSQAPSVVSTECLFGGGSLSSVVSGLLMQCDVHGKMGWEYLKSHGFPLPENSNISEKGADKKSNAGGCRCKAIWEEAVRKVVCSGGVEYDFNNYCRSTLKSKYDSMDPMALWWAEPIDGVNPSHDSVVDATDTDKKEDTTSATAEKDKSRDKKDKKDKKDKEKKDVKKSTKVVKKEHVFGDLGLDLGLDGGFGDFLSADIGFKKDKKSDASSKEQTNADNSEKQEVIVDGNINKDKPDADEKKKEKKKGKALDFGGFGGSFDAFLNDDVPKKTKDVTSVDKKKVTISAADDVSEKTNAEKNEKHPESDASTVNSESGGVSQSLKDATGLEKKTSDVSIADFSAFLSTCGVPRQEPWITDRELQYLRDISENPENGNSGSTLSQYSAKMYASASVAEVAYTSTASKATTVGRTPQPTTSATSAESASNNSDTSASSVSGVSVGMTLDNAPANGVTEVVGSMGARIVNTEGKIMSPYVTPVIRLFSGRTGTSLFLLPRDTTLFSKLSRMYTRETMDGSGIVAIELFCSELFGMYRRTLSRMQGAREILVWYPLYNELPAIASHGLRRDTQKAVRGASALYGDGVILHRSAATAAAESRSAQKFGEQRHYQMLLCVAAVSRWSARREGRTQGGSTAVITADHVVVYDDAQAYPLALVKFA